MGRASRGDLSSTDLFLSGGLISNRRNFEGLVSKLGYGIFAASKAARINGVGHQAASLSNLLPIFGTTQRLGTAEAEEKAKGATAGLVMQPAAGRWSSSPA